MQLTCLNDHPVKTRSARIQLSTYPARCPVCGCTGRKWLRTVPWRVTLGRHWQRLRALLTPRPCSVVPHAPPSGQPQPPALHSRD